jgi:hypothetical protein
MTSRVQSWSELKEVLELAVIESTATLVRVPYRLPAAAQIDDAQPSHPQKDVAAPHRAAVIGTTMRQEISAPPQRAVCQVQKLSTGPRCHT